MAILTNLISPPKQIPNGTYTVTVVRVFEGMRLIKTQIPAFQMPVFGFSFDVNGVIFTHKFDVLGTNNANGIIEIDESQSPKLWKELGKFGYCCGMKQDEIFVPTQLLNRKCSITFKNNKIIKITPP